MALVQLGPTPLCLHDGLIVIDVRHDRAAAVATTFKEDEEEDVQAQVAGSDA
jgi:hypothetical protein